MCKLLIAAGAHTLISPNVHVDPYKVPPEEIGCVDSPSFLAWLEIVKRTGVGATYGPLASAHQMGSCPMGTSPRNSAVDPRGRVWGTEGLYVADASVFPTASGVNPMVTVSHYYARPILVLRLNSSTHVHVCRSCPWLTQSPSLSKKISGRMAQGAVTRLTCNIMPCGLELETIYIRPACKVHYVL